MRLSVMAAAERDGKLVAHFEAQSARLRKAKVMGALVQRTRFGNNVGRCSQLQRNWESVAIASSDDVKKFLESQLPSSAFSSLKLLQSFRQAQCARCCSQHRGRRTRW